MKKIGWLLCVAIIVHSLSTYCAAFTRDEVIKRGYLQCGVATSMPGFSDPDEGGNWTGFDVDFCRAVAAATLSDSKKVKYIPLTPDERFTALQSGEVDLLSRNTTWTMARDTALGVNFVGVSYYDAQGFMVARRLGAASALELDGAAICLQAGTTTELNLADYFSENNMTYKSVIFGTSDQTIKGFENGRCDVLTSGLSLLYGLRTKLTKPEIATILPQVISKDPLGPVVRQGDDGWFNIVKWVLFAMINGEELGITSANIDSMTESPVQAIRRLIGLDGIRGEGLGISDDWAYQVIKQVGNYGEVYERNLGNNSALKIDRGLNDLWTRGGLLYAPPIR